MRDSNQRVGWVLARMIDLDVPLDVAQYAEGQRIVAFFVLNQVQDGDKKVAQYLTVLTEPKDGLPFDFNQIRVFTWNVKRHRYETAYRERMARRSARDRCTRKLRQGRRVARVHHSRKGR